MVYVYFYESISQDKSIQQLKSYSWFIFSMFDLSLIQNDFLYGYGGSTFYYVSIDIVYI
jgi:hypothetical protein